MKRKQLDIFQLFIENKFYASFFSNDSEMKRIQIREKVKGNIKLTDYEYYFNNVEFCIIQINALCEDLSLSLDFIFDLKYKKNFRDKHISFVNFQLENHIIRLHSVSDWILQLINEIYNLNIGEERVNYNSVFSKKTKEILDINLQNLVDTLNQILDPNQTRVRDKIIHRYKYFNPQLRHVQMLHSYKNIRNNFIDYETIDENTKFELGLSLEIIVREYEHIHRITFLKVIEIFNVLEVVYINNQERLEQTIQ